MYNNHDIYGVKGEDVCCGAMNTGLFATIKDIDLCEWVVSGHDHDNDYYGTYDGVKLAFGRKTGHGSYLDNLQHGARVFEFDLKDEDTGEYEIKTWIREENGSIVIQD